MKKKTILIFLYLVYLVILTLVVDKLPYYLWFLFEKVGIYTYGIGMCIVTLVFIVTLVLFTIFGGYIILRQLIKSERKSQKFLGVFLLCLVISISAFNVWQADIPGIYYKTSKSVEVFTEASDSGTPIIVSRGILGPHIDADFRCGEYLEFLPGSDLHSKLAIDEDIKLYLKTDYCRSYSYIIG